MPTLEGQNHPNLCCANGGKKHPKAPKQGMRMADLLQGSPEVQEPQACEELRVFRAVAKGITVCGYGTVQLIPGCKHLAHLQVQRWNGPFQESDAIAGYDQTPLLACFEGLCFGSAQGSLVLSPGLKKNCTLLLLKKDLYTTTGQPMVEMYG